MTNAISPADLLNLAEGQGQREFAIAAVDFVSSRHRLRAPSAEDWGVGDERLTLFHESSDAEERAEAQAAQQWQQARWEAGFGWITGSTTCSTAASNRPTTSPT